MTYGECNRLHNGYILGGIMIKVFLVEDEYAIREGIKKSVNWEANGFELVGEAGDGEMAYPKIVKTKPDILITDIRMPFMDGLELAKLVKNEMPKIKIVVLSGYDDFNYAKQAISIGVEEYILKPVSGENLINQLKTIAESIQNERQDDELREKYLRDREEIRILEQQKFIHDMIDGRLSVKDSLAQGKELGIDITAAYYTVILMQVFPKNAKSGEVDEYSGVSEEIYSRIKEIYADVEHVYLYEQVGDVLCFLEKADSQEEMETNVNKEIGDIKALMANYTDRLFYISVGKPVERLRDVNASYKDASRKFAERFMCDDSYVFYGENASQRERIRETIKAEKNAGIEDINNNSDISKLDINNVDIRMISQKTIYNFLKSGTISEVDDLVEEYFDSMGKEAVESILLRQYVLVESMLSTVAFLENLGISKENISGILGEYSDPVRFVESTDTARAYIKGLLRLAIDYRNQMSDKRYTEIIDKAKKYIQENYQNEDMSLLSVASNVNVSSNHFSAVFRKETGETFIDYLTTVRMEKAKDLLACTSMKTSEVGFEVGYRDPHYFSYIFKKTQGMTPKDYRRTKKES